MSQRVRFSLTLLTPPSPQMEIKLVFQKLNKIQDIINRSIASKTKLIHVKGYLE